MSNVELKKITKTFPGVTALNDVSINIKDGEFFVLLGPTGAGKTTTLRVIAGLEKQNEGDLLFDGKVVNELSPADRDTAFVFQQYSLYPTMTVYENLAFPLRSPMRQLGNEEIAKKVGETAEILHINHLLDRKTVNLSGGEMQRVSIGRAIVRDPRIYLMDEPLSNLDAKLREALRVELQHLQKTQNSTTLFVTHDQIEALTMADRIAVLNRGRIIQIGLPEDIYDRPATTFVAKLVGTPRINLFESEKENGTLRIMKSDLHIPTPQDCELPDQVLLGIRPEDIDPTPDGQFEGEVTLKEPLGVETIIYIKSREQTITSLISGTTDARIGDTIKFNIIQERLHCFDPAGNRIQT
ncbi:MAG: ABC transporter ATP-binding protein [Anaerolineales bacterium]|jgi:multiple sugar transport system ATP-binding protein|nr:ABC transporter ATP-binding protein [Anaerolineales bacterium]